MRVYLARHGDAVEAMENPRRPLSAKGRAEVERMASFLARGGVHPRRVIHSPKLRAGETAAILARVLAPGAVLEESEGLGPEDSPERLVASAKNWTEAARVANGPANSTGNDVLVVGHMPFMAGALAALVGAKGKEVGAGDFADFATAAVACLESEATAKGVRWRLLWLVSPGLLGG
ncbi:MAG: phosphohistidine phosphatase SixA [Rhodospirillales bacterium]|nr:phosphohistidine phosphatase SixA [Rhodospirillales bacterium]